MPQTSPRAPRPRPYVVLFTALLALVLGMAPPGDEQSGAPPGTSADGPHDPEPGASPAPAAPLGGLLDRLLGSLTNPDGKRRDKEAGATAEDTSRTPGKAGGGGDSPTPTPSADGRADPGTGAPDGAAAPGTSDTSRSAASPKVFTGYGFDTCVAPSAQVMRAWLDSPYRAVGVYFGGRGRACPNQPHLTPDWVTEVDGMGWRLLPLYVGSQSPCVQARNKRHVTIDPSRPRAQGESEGRDAVARAKELGLAEGSALYLDMEAYDHRDTACATTTLEFVQGWNREVSRQGYLPGFYSSAESGVRHMAAAREAGRADLPEAIWFARWGVPGSVDDEPVLAPDAWQPHRRIHQYVGNVSETHGGQRLNIDRNRVDAPVGVVP